MARYAEMAKTLLKSENPEELNRLHADGTLNETMQEIQEFFSQQEYELARQMNAEIDKEKQLSQQELLGRRNMAAMCAREIASNDMTEFLRSLR